MTNPLAFKLIEGIRLYQVSADLAPETLEPVYVRSTQYAIRSTVEQRRRSCLHAQASDHNK